MNIQCRWNNDFKRLFNHVLCHLWATQVSFTMLGRRKTPLAWCAKSENSGCLLSVEYHTHSKKMKLKKKISNLFPQCSVIWVCPNYVRHTNHLLKLFEQESSVWEKVGRVDCFYISNVFYYSQKSSVSYRSSGETFQKIPLAQKSGVSQLAHHELPV